MNFNTNLHSRVAYYFDEEIGIYTFKKGHPMRPFRVKMTDELIRTYQLTDYMQCYDSTFFEFDDKVFYQFHSEEYIDLLKNITEDNIGIYQEQFMRFGFSADCPNPVNSKFYDLCKLYTTGSVLGASLLNTKQVDCAINWSGGLHHAKRQEASGFCYVNDCVLGILELLKTHARVLYVDIDVHHGDGVEEAFFTTNRVMTCSFHKFKDFFPGTGNYTDIGYGDGRNHAINFPLSEGINDDVYRTIFRPVIDNIIECFNPGAILLQCGTDSLSGDKLGCFNLSIKGHGQCVEYIKSKNIPYLLVGGGGYTLRNIARCWTHETSVALGKEISNEIPDHKYSDYFYPENKIHTYVSNMQNLNTEEELHFITNTLIQNIRSIDLYSEEARVEHKEPVDSRTAFVEEKKNLNTENQQELSDKYRTDINV